MNCKDIDHKIVDFVDNQLSVEESINMQNHIDSCHLCKQIHEETLLLMGALKSVKVEQPSENLRQNFLKTLDEEKQLQSAKVVSLVKENKEFPWKRAFQVAASIVLMFSGYLFGSHNTQQNANQEISALQEQTTILKEDMMLAMIENQSPSKRIQAVSFTEHFVKPDVKILEALIERMQYDGNKNVRLAAAEALSEFPESDLVKDTFIEALTTQKDPSLQIAIIQFLVKIQEKSAIAPMKQLLEENETQPYVKDEIKSVITNFI